MGGDLKKGFLFEEVLRAYFLRAGNYAVRGVPLRIDKEDITDIDLWLYERPSGASRRTKMVDAKFKKSPKAVERIFFTRGIADYLNIEEAYVATCDERPFLEDFSSKIGLFIINGKDLNVMNKRKNLLFPERMNEEDLISLLRAVDKNRKNKVLKKFHDELKTSLLINLGAGGLNKALAVFEVISNGLIASYPNRNGAEASVRLLYFAASIIAICLDFVLSKFWFRSLSERREAIVNSIRYGHHKKDKGLERLKVAEALVAQHAPNGNSVAQSVNNSVHDYFENIHSELIADYVLENLRNQSLYEMACLMESRAYCFDLKGYDNLSLSEKSFLGILMDFCSVDRVRFACSWTK